MFSSLFTPLWIVSAWLGKSGCFREQDACLRHCTQRRSRVRTFELDYARDVRIRYPPDTALKSEMLRHDDFRGDDLLVSFNGCGTILGGPACEELFWHYHNTSLLTMTVP